MSEIILSDGRIERDFDFTELTDSARAPGWFHGSCLNCDAETTGSETVLVEWAYAHHPDCPGRNTPPRTDDYISNSFEHYRRMVAEMDSYRHTVTKHALGAGWTDEQIMKGLHGE